VNTPDLQIIGARIVQVVEILDQHRIVMEVCRPMDPLRSDFPEQRLIFELCDRYTVSETTGCVGEPTIGGVEVTPQDNGSIAVRIVTTSGFREILCYSVHE
jgi:hypothetical protein